MSNTQIGLLIGAVIIFVSYIIFRVTGSNKKVGKVVEWEILIEFLGLLAEILPPLIEGIAELLMAILGGL